MEGKEGGFVFPDLKLYYEAICLSWMKEWIELKNVNILDLEGANLIYGWHAYLWYKKTKVHKGFFNHVIRSLYKVWMRHRDILERKTPGWISPVEAVAVRLNMDRS